MDLLTALKRRKKLQYSKKTSGQRRSSSGTVGGMALDRVINPGKYRGEGPFSIEAVNEMYNRKKRIEEMGRNF